MKNGSEDEKHTQENETRRQTLWERSGGMKEIKKVLCLLARVRCELKQRRADDKEA